MIFYHVLETICCLIFQLCFGVRDHRTVRLVVLSLSGFGGVGLLNFAFCS